MNRARYFLVVYDGENGPDRNHGNEEEAAEKFKEVNAAYGVLNDPQERKW